MIFTADQAWRMVSVGINNLFFVKNQAPTNGFTQILDCIDRNKIMQKNIFNTSAAGMPKIIIMAPTKNNNGFFGFAFSLQRC